MNSMIRKNNERKIGKVEGGLADSNPPKTKNDGQSELDADKDVEDEETMVLPIDMEQDDTGEDRSEGADVDEDEADKKPVAPKIRKTEDAVKLVKTVNKVNKPLNVAADGERDEDELQLDNDEDEDDIVGDDHDDDADQFDDCDDQPEYAVQKRTYIKLNCVHCHSSFYTIKVHHQIRHIRNAILTVQTHSCAELQLSFEWQPAPESAVPNRTSPADPDEPHSHAAASRSAQSGVRTRVADGRT